MFEAGTRIRVKTDPGRIGILTGKYRERANRIHRQIFFPDISTYLPEDQIECLPDISDPLELLEAGKLGRASDYK
jgi:hypothetical protein